MSFDQNARQVAYAQRLANNSTRKAARVDLEGGWSVYPDAPPGVGWVVAAPATDKHGAMVQGGGLKRYYGTRELAMGWARHYQKTGPEAGR